MFTPGFNNQQYGYNSPAMPYMPDFRAVQPQQQASANNVSWVYVNGIEGARGQIVQPGQTSWMMDNNEPVIYVKSVDGMGTATLKAFRLTEITTNSQQASAAINMDAYAQKNDIDELSKRITAIEDIIGGLNS